MKQPNKNDYFVDVDNTNILPYDQAYRAYRDYADDLEDYITHLKQVKNNGALDTVIKCTQFQNSLTSSSATKCVCGKEKYEHEYIG